MILERNRRSQLALLTIAMLAAIAGQTDAQKAAKLTAVSTCASKEKCHTCIQTEGCAWCMQPDFKGQSRCYQNTSSLCPEEFAYSPITLEEILVNNKLTNQYKAELAAGGSGIGVGIGAGIGGGSSMSSSGFSSSSGYEEYSAGEIVQIQPQSMRLALRVNEKHNIKISYSQAEGYPVDLYYLMDLSKSMEDDKAKLSTLGDKLSETMKRITNNFHLGFGSFVDKVLMPYVSTIPKKLQHPCENCKAPYGYQNHMPLNNNTESFSVRDD